MTPESQTDAHGLRCRICDAGGPHQSFSIREMMFGTRENFQYFLCRVCGCLQISEIPSDLERHYPSNYYSMDKYHPGNRDHWAPLTRAFMRQRVRLALFGRGYRIARLVSCGRPMPALFFRSQPALLRNANLPGFDAAILDVGCGDAARWLHDLGKLGFNRLSGVDPFIERSRTVQGVQLIKSDLATFAIGREGTFDLVTFNHSLEHLPNQAEALATTVSLLKPQATCVVRIPVLPCASWDKYGTDWVELDAPRHLYIHSHTSIRMLGEQVGMKLNQVFYDTSDFEFYGSEQYARDIALTDSQSVWTNPNTTLFSPDERRRFEELAAQANRTETAGRAAFVFRKA